MFLRVHPTVYIALAAVSYLPVWAGDFVVAVVPTHQHDFANVAERTCAIGLAVIFIALCIAADCSRRKSRKNPN
jgi:hypothetical protein